MICPKCSNDNCQYIDRVLQKNSFSKACCGATICGPIGILLGIGSNTQEQQYWVCNQCGNKFQSIQSNGIETVSTPQNQQEAIEQENASIEALELKKIQELNDESVKFKYTLDLKDALTKIEKHFVAYIEREKGNLEYVFQDKIIFGRESKYYNKTNGLLYKVADITHVMKPDERILCILAQDKEFLCGIILSNQTLYFPNDKIPLEDIEYISLDQIYTKNKRYCLEQSITDEFLKVLRFTILNSKLIKNNESIKPVQSAITFGLDRNLVLNENDEAIHINGTSLVYPDRVVQWHPQWKNLVYLNGTTYCAIPTIATKEKKVLEKTDSKAADTFKSLKIGLEHGLSASKSALKKMSGYNVDHSIAKIFDTPSILDKKINFIKDFMIQENTLYIRRSNPELQRNQMVRINLENKGEVEEVITQPVLAYTVLNDELYYCVKENSAYNIYCLRENSRIKYCSVSEKIDNLFYYDNYFYSLLEGILYRFNDTTKMTPIQTNVKAFDIDRNNNLYYSTGNGVFSRPDFKDSSLLSPIEDISKLYISNGLLYLYSENDLTIKRADGKYHIDE